MSRQTACPHSDGFTFDVSGPLGVLARDPGDHHRLAGFEGIIKTQEAASADRGQTEHDRCVYDVEVEDEPPIPATNATTWGIRATCRNI